jgi:hypothetical protein
MKMSINLVSGEDKMSNPNVHMYKRVSFLAIEFRKAVECAQNEGAFNGNQILSRFPKGCCGEISSLLAKYLFENGINSYEVSGTFRSENPEETQSHAWLMLEGNTIVDITGDQFKNNPLFQYFSKEVYIGPMNDFYELFEDIAKFPYEDFTEGTSKINIQRKKNYEIILGYIQN